VNFDVNAFKQHFPLLCHPDNHQLVYLDNAASTQKPQAVIDAISHFYQFTNANAHRASHRLARAATQTIETVRAEVAQFIDAQIDEIVFCRGATEGLNLLANTLTDQCHAGDEIILTRTEHHANLLPWQALARRVGMQIRFVPDINGIPDVAAIPDMLSPTTKIVALTLASNVLGCRLPIESIATSLKAHGCLVILDAAQALAHTKISVNNLGCDFLVGSAHKCYGPLGIGFLYGQSTQLNALPPWQVGGEMVAKVTDNSAIFAPAPQRFEAGTMSLADIAGFGACLTFLKQFDRSQLQAHEEYLTDQLHQALATMQGIHLISQAQNNFGITTFTLEPSLSASVADLALWLDEHDIAVRAGFHCAQPLYAHLGVSQGIRLSVAAYNTQADCHRVIQAIQQWLELQQTAQAIAATKATSSMPTTEQITQNLDQMFQIDHINPQLKNLANITNWQARYKLLMQAGAQIRAKPLIHTSAHLIQGCEANTWLAHYYTDGLNYFAIDSESRIVKGLGALLLTWFEAQTTEHINSFDWHTECKHLNLERHLTASRNNGFRALILKAQALSLACLAK